MRRSNRIEAAAQCPSDLETYAEAFWMGKLELEEAQWFARHCETCPACAAESEMAWALIEVIRETLREDGRLAVYRCPPVVLGTG